MATGKRRQTDANRVVFPPARWQLVGAAKRQDFAILSGRLTSVRLPVADRAARSCPDRQQKSKRSARRKLARGLAIYGGGDFNAQLLIV